MRKTMWLHACVLLCALASPAELCAEEKDAPPSPLILPEQACGPIVIAHSSTWREEVEASLQRLRWAPDEAAFEMESRVLYVWLNLELNRFFTFHHVHDEDARQDLVHDSFRSIYARLQRARREQEAPRIYLNSLFWHANRHLFNSIRKGKGGDAPAGDMRELADFSTHQPPPSGRVAFSFEEASPIPVIEAQDPLSLRYSHLRGVPLSLSGFQLTVLRELARGSTHQGIATAQSVGIRQVHDAIGNVETKLQKELGDASVRRSELTFIPDLSGDNRVFIHFSRGSQKALFMGEGPLPFETNELAFMHRWLTGADRASIQKELGITSDEGARLYFRLLVERRRDFEELFGDRMSVFYRTFDVELSPALGEFALFKSYGLEREEIATLLDTRAPNIATQRDRVVRALRNVVQPIDRTLNFRHLYFCAVEDSRTQVQIIASNESGQLYLFRAHIGDKQRRQEKRQEIFVDRAEVAAAIGRMEGRLAEVMRLLVLEGKKIREVSIALGVREDTVKKYSADGTFQLGVACQEPDLNLFNLRLRK